MEPNPAAVAHGPMLIGVIINFILLGMLFIQVFNFYNTYPGDRLWIKAFVAAILLLNLASSALCGTYIYQGLILHFGDGDYLMRITWIFGVGNPIMTGIITVMVQLFFAWRIFVFTRRWIYLALIGIPALIGGGAAIVAPVVVSKRPFFSELDRATIPNTIWLGAGVLTNILITYISVTHLKKRKTGLQRSDMLVDRVTKLSLQTGLVTTIVAFIDIVFFFIKTGRIHILFTFTLAKLYSTSLLSSLNSRQPRYRKGDGKKPGPNGALSELVFDHQNPFTITGASQLGSGIGGDGMSMNVLKSIQVDSPGRQHHLQLGTNTSSPHAREERESTVEDDSATLHGHDTGKHGQRMV